MNIERVAPSLIILLSVCSAAGYGYVGDWRKCVYWVGATIIGLAVTI